MIGKSCELFALEYKLSNERGILLFQGREVLLENKECERYDLSGADLEEASLENAVVSHSDFSVVRLKKDNLEER